MKEVDKQCWEALKFLRSRMTQGCIAAHIGVKLARVFRIEVDKCRAIRAWEYFEIMKLKESEIKLLEEEAEYGYEEKSLRSKNPSRKPYKAKERSAVLQSQDRSATN